MKKYLYTAALLAFVLLPSCTQNPDEVLDTATITFSVDEFVRDGAKTKTNVDPANNYAITWAEGDEIGIFPENGFQEPFEIPASQVGNATAIFDGGYWQIKDGLKYNAYYPFDKANFQDRDSYKRIPVSYTGQTQNGTECNAGAYDYTYSDWSIAADGKVSFAFHHLGAFLILKLKLPATATYTTMRISSKEMNIPLRGTYDLSSANPIFIADPSSMATAINLELNNYHGVKNEDATFYLMIPPIDLGSTGLNVVLSSTSGDTIYAIDSKCFNPATLYEIYATPTDLNNGWIENYYGHDYVDLGLSVKWARMNIGATIYDYDGDYFAWGEVETYYEGKKYERVSPFTEFLTLDYKAGKENGYSINNYKYYKVEHSYEDGFEKTISGFTKYVNEDNKIYGFDGFFDNKSTLEQDDDAAHVIWGGKWRMPTNIELKELINKCTWSEGNLNNVAGFKVQSKVEGYTDRWIFIPKAGYFYNNSNSKTDTRLWSSSANIEMYAPYAYILSGDSFQSDIATIGRYYGLPIRPVFE